MEPPLPILAPGRASDGEPATHSGWPIARLLPVLLVGLTFLAMVPVIAIAYVAAESNYAEAARQRNELRLALIQRRLEAHLQPVHAQLSYLAQAIERGEIDYDNPEQWRSFALGALAAAPQAVGYVVYPVTGEPTRFTRADRSARPDRRENIPQAPDVLALARGMSEPQWAGPVWSDTVDEPILPIIAPIRVRGEFRGFIGAAISTSDLSRFVKEMELPGERTPFILVGRDGVLAHPYLGKESGIAAQRARRRLPTIDEVNDPVLAAMWAPDSNPLDWQNASSSAAGHWNWVNDRSFAWVYREVDEYAPARLTIGFHEAGRESARARWMVRGILIAGVLLMLLAAFTAIMLGRRLSRPILALADAAGAVERLEFDRIPVLRDTGVRELNRANQAFERMARGLRLSATYLPRALVARLTARDSELPANENRAISVMFCDLERYTDFARGRPAQEAATYLNEMLARVGPAIEATGGTIDKYIGDGLMAFWGAPEPTDDHCRAACLAALAVAREVEAFNRDRRARGEAACRMRIGLHTGMVMVGNVGFSGRVDYTAIGDAVNVASRLEQYGRNAPKEGEVTIVVGASCRAAAGDGFDWRVLGGRPADVAAESALPLSVLTASAG